MIKYYGYMRALHVQMWALKAGINRSINWPKYYVDPNKNNMNLWYKVEDLEAVLSKDQMRSLEADCFTIVPEYSYVPNSFE